MPLIDAEPYEFAFAPGAAALLIIDMQRDFLEPGGFGESLGDDGGLLRRMIARTGRVRAAARAAGLAVIHTREGHRPDLSDLPPQEMGLRMIKAQGGIFGRAGRSDGVIAALDAANHDRSNT